MKSTTKRIRRTRFVALGTLVAAFGFGACSTDRNQQPREDTAALQQALPAGDPSVGPPSCAQTVSGDNIVHTFNAEVACGQHRCVLEQAATVNQTTGNVTGTIVVSRKGQAIMSITTQTLKGSTQVTVDYGQEFKGMQHASFISDGQFITGNIDGRSIVPLAVGADPNSATFQDGGPAPEVKINKDVEKAINVLFQTAQQQPHPCASPRPLVIPGGGVDLDLTAEPGHPSFPESSPACIQCSATCVTGWAICGVGVAVGCLASGPFFGFCVIAGILGCVNALFICNAVCRNEFCCPVPCGIGCCLADETCLAGGLGLCCSPGTTTCGTSACCAPNEGCINPNAGTCCPVGQENCGGECCPLFTGCDTSTMTCCPFGAPFCNGVCCAGGEQCTVNDGCCPLGQACGNGCCDASEICVNGTCTASGCPVNEQLCFPTIPGSGPPICCPQTTGCFAISGVSQCCPPGEFFCTTVSPARCIPGPCPPP